MVSIHNFIDVDVEQRTLGFLIHNNSAYLEFQQNDFAYEAHQKILGRMNTLFAHKQDFNVMDFVDFDSSGFEDNIHAVQYLRDCANMSYDNSNEQAKYYRDYLRNLANKRKWFQTFETGQHMLDKYNASDIAKWVSKQNTAHTEATCVKTCSDIHQRVIGGLELPNARHKTGLIPLDKATQGGLYQGFTYGFAGKEKAGKTTLAHTISFNLAQNGCKHLYIALEMGAEMIHKRNIARELGVNSMLFLNPNSELTKKAAALDPNPNLFYLDAPGATYQELIHEVTVSIIRHNIQGVIIDYWQLVGGHERGQTEEAHLRAIAQGFADFARKNGIWCMMLAQLNKDGQLFGGNGLRKACDQLYFIREAPKYPSHRWLEMDASRYTPKADIGAEDNPSLLLNKYQGPYFQAA